MPDGYDTQVDYVGWVADDADKRQENIESALREVFSSYIEIQEVEVIIFSNLTVFDLAEAIKRSPLIFKPLVTICNIAARAIERDLGIRNLDTYAPKFKGNQADVIAGYIKPFLPLMLEVPVLSKIDRVAFIDKEIRMNKGRWEKKVINDLNRFGKLDYYKRKFVVNNNKYELDAAFPKQGNVLIGVDVKRIEARRDIHKRCDEIVNKAAKLKTVYPESKFGVVIYYPFIDEHSNVQNRLSSKNIDAVAFASQVSSSIENAVRMLLSTIETNNHV